MQTPDILNVTILDKVQRIFDFHPSYNKKFVEMYEFLLNKDGPISPDIRCIIGIMASGRHACCCIMNLLQSKFQRLGGDSKLLKGFQNLPEKLQKLNEINKILAHQPWLINESHFQALHDANWTKSEICQAVVLLTYFHALSTLVFSLGLINDADISHVCGRKADSNPSSLTSSLEMPSPRPSVIAKQPFFDPNYLKIQLEKINLANKAPTNEKESAEMFEEAESEACSLEILPEPELHIKEMELRFLIDDPEFGYHDFIQKGKNSARTFRGVDFSWSGNGASIVDSLYDNVGGMLDEKFKLAYSLTYNTLGNHKNVDTSAFRTAIWYYIHCLYGIRHDDYYYRNVNQVLSIRLKTFIKNLVCWPERVTKADAQSILPHNKEDEKAHVNLLIFEARLQSELLYAARALERFLVSNC